MDAPWRGFQPPHPGAERADALLAMKAEQPHMASRGLFGRDASENNIRAGLGNNQASSRKLGKGLMLPSAAFPTPQGSQVPLTGGFGLSNTAVAPLRPSSNAGGVGGNLSAGYDPLRRVPAGAAGGGFAIHDDAMDVDTAMHTKDEANGAGRHDLRQVLFQQSEQPQKKASAHGHGHGRLGAQVRPRPTTLLDVMPDEAIGCMRRQTAADQWKSFALEPPPEADGDGPEGQRLSASRAGGL
eukprot:TRINITY_DN18581_c0_g1_i1.p1 TRINITY_DN18581_c0_g1~~TRINITY_DN18581_c0_g1_i1.p1  ORF type:complete len:262 (+),score=50.41 TRINITY_DN18581_c0_g1_i1:64-786(+)